MEVDETYLGGPEAGFRRASLQLSLQTRVIEWTARDRLTDLRDLGGAPTGLSKIDGSQKRGAACAPGSPSA